MQPRTYQRLLQLQFALLIILFSWLGLTSTPGEMLTSANDLMLHFCGYIGGGISISLCWPQLRFWRRWLALLIYSLVIEIAQHFIPNRGFDVYDLAANGAGIATGIFLYWCFVAALEARVKAFFVASHTL